MSVPRFKKKLLAITLVLLLLVFCESASAQGGAIDVDLTIPVFGGGGGGGGSEPPPPDNAPSISNVTATSTQSTALIAWNAIDDNGIASVSFEYGTSLSYGSNAPVVGSYQTGLSGLTPGTQYFFRITVTDGANQSVSATGNLSTLPAVDITPPVLSSITVNPDNNEVTISWLANEASDGQVNYGLTSGYGSTVPDGAFSTSHSITIINLSENTVYHFRIIATDQAGNATTTLDSTFSTLPDNVPPPDVANLTVVGNVFPTLSWTNPLIVDFARVVLLRKVGSYSANPGDGTVVYSGGSQTYTDNSVTSSVTYFYTAFSEDNSNNHSGGTFVNWLRPAPPAEVCTNGVDDDENGKVDCVDAACSGALICQPPETVPENCGNGIDDDGNGHVDCSDPVCSATLVCMIVVNPPDEGGEDPGEPGGDPSGTGGTGPGGGSVTSGTSTSTINPPVQTVPEYIRASLNDFEFFAGKRQIALFPGPGGEFSSLSGADFTILVNEEKLPSTPDSILLIVDGREKHGFMRVGGSFATDIIFPPPGSHPAFIEIDYGNGQVDVLEITLKGQPLGEILSGREPVEGAFLSLRSENGDVFPTVQFGMLNPITSATGKYGFVVPNGRYYLEVNREGFRERRTPVFEVRNNLVNLPINLIPLPPPLELSLKSIAGQTKAIAQISLEKIGDTAAIVQDLRNNEVVQETASEIVAPASVSAMTVSTVILVPWDKLISFFQLIFFQPVLLINKKKRQGWGKVYNAFNKLPIDLATVRLISQETGKMVQSKVTDSKGKYAFFAPPGKYIIQVVKNNFVFPSAVLHGVKSDGIMADIYHGEAIEVSDENAVVTANIPLDPVGETGKPVRLYWEVLGRRIQTTLSWSGFVVTLISLYVSPEWYVWVLLFVHLGLIYIFYRLALPPKIKSWGIVYDLQTKTPVGRVIARLFNIQYNKLVGTQITDDRGRYYFLAGDNDYFITYEHPNYQTIRSSKIDLRGHEAENINIDIGLKKN